MIDVVSACDSSTAVMKKGRSVSDLSGCADGAANVDKAVDGDVPEIPEAAVGAEPRPVPGECTGDEPAAAAAPA